jgi:prepilin-type N-terminal cleavage/methylation domain-containing protein
MKGITLIELLLVVAIFAIIAGAAIPVLGQLQTSTQLNQAASELVQTLRDARQRSVAGLNNSSHGVYFQAPDQIILYQGDNYSSRDPAADQVTILDSTIQFTITVPGNDLNFAKATGDPSQTGIIALTHKVSDTRSITINQYGLIESQ